MLGARTRRLLPLFAIPMVLVAAACGGDEATADSTSTESSSAAAQDDTAFEDQTGRDEVVIQVRDNSFMGQHVTVSAGTTVTFDNRGRNPHNAVPVDDGAFADVPTESLQPGQAATVVFGEPGEYPYYCTLHGTATAGMVGTIRVVD